MLTGANEFSSSRKLEIILEVKYTAAAVWFGCGWVGGGALGIQKIP